MAVKVLREQIQDKEKLIHSASTWLNILLSKCKDDLSDKDKATVEALSDELYDIFMDIRRKARNGK